MMDAEEIKNNLWARWILGRGVLNGYDPETVKAQFFMDLQWLIDTAKRESGTDLLTLIAQIKQNPNLKDGQESRIADTPTGLGVSTVPGGIISRQDIAGGLHGKA